MANFTFLDIEHIDEMLALQEAVMKHLHTHGNEHFIIERARTYFEKHVQEPSAILGIRSDDGQLVAQSIFHHSDTLNPDYIKGLTLDDWKLCDPVSTLQGVLIHPNAQGQGLSSRIVDAWIIWATDKSYKHVLTRVEEHNTKSIKSFIKAGMEDVGAIIDARDNATVKVLHRRLGDD